MAESRSVRISEAVWAKLKQRALDERVTLREVMERAAHQYLLGGALKSVAAADLRDIGKIYDACSGTELAKHWTPPEDIP